MTWPTKAQKWHAQFEQAQIDAQRLGHDTGDWLNDYLSPNPAETFKAFCHRCRSYVVVEPYATDKLPIRGPVVQFRCEGRRATYK